MSSKNSKGVEGKGVIHKKGRRGIKEPTREEVSGIQGKTKEQLKHEIDLLLSDLRDAETADEKKGLRRKLRARGHFGGLGDGRGRKAGTKTKEEVKAKGKRALPEAKEARAAAKAAKKGKGKGRRAEPAPEAEEAEVERE